MLDFKKILSSIADIGQSLLGKKFSKNRDLKSLLSLCDDLISYKGTASGIAIAREISEIYKILDKGLRVKTATRKFSINGKEYDYGTYMIPVQSQQLNSDEIYKLLNKLSKEYNVDFEPHTTGITDGIDFGSNDFIIVKQPKIGLIVGDGVRSYDAGEVWHLLDVRFDIPITKIDVGNLREIDLSKYSHIILPDYVGLSLIHI